ncbi:MAG TPA: hypothetical protein VMF59_04390 [Bacteroidota bacterium]|nr:hypothetical protein [Bacteroidota bacterium]
MKDREEFSAVFAKLKSLLHSHAASLVVVNDTRDYYYLNTRWVTKDGKPIFFGAVWKGKGYVSYYLMPVYKCPGLMKRASPGLKKHQQGKSCFNFTRMDSSLFRELSKITKAGLAEFRVMYSPQK